MISKWEDVDVNTDRLRVAGGYIYRTMLGSDNTTLAVSMVFVPDQKQEDDNE